MIPSSTSFTLMIISGGLPGILDLCSHLALRRCPSLLRWCHRKLRGKPRISQHISSNHGGHLGSPCPFQPGLLGSSTSTLHPAVIRYSPPPECQRRLSGDPELLSQPKSNEVEPPFPHWCDVRKGLLKEIIEIR